MNSRVRGLQRPARRRAGRDGSASTGSVPTSRAAAGRLRAGQRRRPTWESWAPSVLGWPRTKARAASLPWSDLSSFATGHHTRPTVGPRPRGPVRGDRRSDGSANCPTTLLNRGADPRAQTPWDLEGCPTTEARGWSRRDVHGAGLILEFEGVTGKEYRAERRGGIDRAPGPVTAPRTQSSHSGGLNAGRAPGRDGGVGHAGDQVVVHGGSPRRGVGEGRDHRAPVERHLGRARSPTRPPRRTPGSGGSGPDVVLGFEGLRPCPIGGDRPRRDGEDPPLRVLEVECFTDSCAHTICAISSCVPPAVLVLHLRTRFQRAVPGRELWIACIT